MGGAQTGGTPPPPSGGGGVDLSSLLGILTAIYNVLLKAFGLNQSQPIIDPVDLTTGGAFQQMYPGTKAVESAIIQNISTENVTLTTATQGQVAGLGILLTKANNAGEGGGSHPVGNVDLAKFYFVRATAGHTLAVYYEI